MSAELGAAPLHRDQLLAWIEDLLAERLDVLSFEKLFYDYYLESVPPESLSDRELEFFGLVQEGLDWTAASPARSDRECGWFDHEEYVEWVRRLKRAFEAGEPLFFR